MDFAKATKLGRALKGFQQKDLARLSGLDPSLISLIESGKRNPSQSTIQQIAEAFGIPPHLFTLMAAEKNDLRLIGPHEMARVTESLAELIFVEPKKPRHRIARRHPSSKN